MKVDYQLPKHFRKNKTFLLQVILGVGFVLTLSDASAAGFEKRILVNSALEHDSNPAMSEKGKEPVWILSVTPQVKLGLRDELNLWYLDAALSVQRPSNQKTYIDREDPKLVLGWDRTYESGMFGVKGSYEESSSRVDQLNTSGVFTGTDDKLKTRVLAATWQHAINSRWSVVTDGAYRDIKHTIPGTLDNYRISEIKSQLTYEVNEKLNTFASLGYAHLQPEKASEGNTNMSRFTVGANYQVNEGLSILTNAGLYNLSGRQSDSDWVAGIKADYATSRMDYFLGLNRELVASGVGGFRQVDALKLGWQFGITENDKVGAEYSLNKYKKDSSVGLDRLDIEQINGFYDRVLTEHWKARVSATLKDIDTPSSHAKGNVIGFSLVYDTLDF